MWVAYQTGADREQHAKIVVLASRQVGGRIGWPRRLVADCEQSTAILSPMGAMSDNPARQGCFKANVVAHLLGLIPFVPQDFFALREKLAIQ